MNREIFVWWIVFYFILIKLKNKLPLEPVETMFNRLSKFGLNYGYKICLSASIASWIDANKSQFNVPSFEQVQETLSNHNSSNNEMNDLNQRFFEDEYDKLIEKFDKRFTNTKRREILLFIPQIVDEIGDGKNGLKDKCIIEIGSGTGTFIPAFSNSIGHNGYYIGLDISPAFIYYLNDNLSTKYKNILLNKNTPTSLCLPQELKGKVDVIFTSATYHHLDDVNGTLQQIYDYLKPGGKFIVSDFKKPEESWYEKYGDNPKYNGMNDIDTYSSSGKPMFEWLKGHIRFTEKEAKQEIEMNGFVFHKSIMNDQWKHHFIHVYKKPSFY